MVGSITLSCGCRFEGVDYPASEMISWGDSTREGRPAIGYGEYCLKCAARWRDDGLTLDSEEAKQEWLNRKRA